MSAQHELEHPPSDAISSLEFSPTSDKLMVGSWDKTVSCYQRTPHAEGGNVFTLLWRMECEAPVLDICWGVDEMAAFSVGLDQDVRSIRTREQEVLSSHEMASNKVAYSSEHHTVLSTSWDGTMHVHDPETKVYIRVRLPGKPFALSLTASRAVVAMEERKVSVYDLQVLKQLIVQAGVTADNQEILEVAPWQQRESSLKFMTRAIACMPDGGGFATSSIEGRVGVEWFDPELQNKTYAFKCHRQATTTTTDVEGQEAKKVDIVYPVNALAFHPVHGTFATGGGDGVVALWDAQSKRRVRQYQKLDASVAALDFSQDGRFLAIAISPGFEDGMEEEDDFDKGLVKVVVRELGADEAKGKAVKS